MQLFSAVCEKMPKRGGTTMILTTTDSIQGKNVSQYLG
nr:MAG TPA: Putative heavy-metal-binding protein [Caudoviricetes sp.]